MAFLSKVVLPLYGRRDWTRADCGAATGQLLRALLLLQIGVALLAAALLTLAINPRSVTWLYAVAEAAAAAMAVLCVIRLWRRRARVSFAVFITLLFVAVSSLGAAGGAINMSNALIWRAHIAAEVCIFMFAAAFYLRGSLGNGEAS